MSKLCLRGAVGLFALAMLPLLGSEAAANTTYRYSGHDCKPRDPADTHWWYDSVGMRNNTTLADSVRAAWCPVGGWQDSAVDLESAEFNYYDGTIYYSVYCQLFVTNKTGGVYSSSTKYSCAADTVNGCTSNSGPYQGYGSLTWSAGSLPNAGSNILNAGPYGYFCNVPSAKNYDYFDARYVTQASSRLLSYAVEHVVP